jgi:hypothetical protein
VATRRRVRRRVLGRALLILLLRAVLRTLSPLSKQARPLWSDLGQPELCSEFMKIFLCALNQHAAFSCLNDSRFGLSMPLQFLVSIPDAYVILIVTEPSTLLSVNMNKCFSQEIH